MKPHLVFLFAFLTLAGCMGGSLSKIPSSLEEQDANLPLRPASEMEGNRLRQCLRAAEQAQQKFLERKGAYARSLVGLGLEEPCQGLKVRLFLRGQKAFEVWTDILGAEKAVRWSVNQKGVMEEHLDSKSLEDLDF